MPRLLGLEPDKWKPIALIGGGGLILFLVLRPKGAPAIAAEAPTGAAPVMGVSSPAASPELASSALAATALQTQMRQDELTYQRAANNLSLQNAAQQMAFQGEQQRTQATQQTEQNYYANKLSHEALRKAQGRNDPWWKGAQELFSTALEDVTAYRKIFPSKRETDH